MTTLSKLLPPKLLNPSTWIISTPTPKKLLAMASLQSLRVEFINLSPKTLLPRSWPLTTASTECVLILGILPLVDPNLLNSSFVSPLPLSLTPIGSPFSRCPVPLTVSLASHLLDNFSTVVWLGLATCWRRTSERILSVGSLHAPVFCLLFHSVSPSPGLVKLPCALQSTGMR